MEPVTLELLGRQPVELRETVELDRDPDADRRHIHQGLYLRMQAVWVI